MVFSFFCVFVSLICFSIIMLGENPPLISIVLSSVALLITIIYLLIKLKEEYLD